MIYTMMAQMLKSDGRLDQHIALYKEKIEPKRQSQIANYKKLDDLFGLRLMCAHYAVDLLNLVETLKAKQSINEGIFYSN